MSKTSGSSNTEASRLAEPSQICTFWPASIAYPPNSTSRVAVRRFDGDGDVQRTISSTAVGSSARSARTASSCGGGAAQRPDPPPPARWVGSAPPLDPRGRDKGETPFRNEGPACTPPPPPGLRHPR